MSWSLYVDSGKHAMLTWYFDDWANSVYLFEANQNYLMNGYLVLQLQQLTKLLVCTDRTRGRSAQDPPNHSRRLLCSDAISDEDIDRTGKVRNAMEEFLQGFRSLHTWLMSATCFSSFTPANLRKIAKCPLFQSPFPMEIPTVKKPSAPWYTAYQSFIWQ